MKRYAIVCESMTGNTAILAQALREHLRRTDVPILNPAAASAEDYDVFFVGSWTDKGDCAAGTAAFLESLQNKEIFLFGTCGFGGSDSYYDTVYRRFAAHVKPDNRINGHFICQGKMPAQVLARFEAMKEANPDASRWDECIENYNRALTHPDGTDVQNLCCAVDQALEAV